jgi:quinohemoprotein ethanol dehydrogenase
MYFVCSQSGALGLVVPPEPQKYKEGETYIGPDTIVATGFDTTDYLTAYDMSTGKIRWQKESEGESCYSGAVTTAGGLVFVGHNDGNLVAYNVETTKNSGTGRPARANTTVTPFELEGEEKIAIYAAGKEIFSEECSVCHDATGHGGNGGPDLRTMPLAKTQAGEEKQVTNGGGGMPAFKGVHSEEEISNVAAYVAEDIVGGK